MRLSLPPLFMPYMVTNFGLVFIGYEAASSHRIPHWIVILLAAALSAVIALVWSRTLAHAHRREDRALSMFAQLFKGSQTPNH